MRKNPVKEKLRNGEPTFGTWLTLGNFLGTRVMARMGWDWLTLDIEHGAFDWSQAEQIFAAVADALLVISHTCTEPEPTVTLTV